jgi:predicted component of type VI protein secretion system
VNYKVPLDFPGFFQKFELSRNKKHLRISPELEKVSSLRSSIDEFLELLVFTHTGECKFAYDFGFSFWESEFQNLTIESFNNSEYPRKRFEDNLKDAIQKYEPHLTDVKVEILLSDEHLVIRKTSIRFFVVIVIFGYIKGIQKEPYKKNIVFSVGPVVKK